MGKMETLRFLYTFKIEKEMNRILIFEVARTSLNTKIVPNLANPLTEIIVDAVNCIQVEDKPVDLHMIEIMHMQHKMSLSPGSSRGSCSTTVVAKPTWHPASRTATSCA
jgi:T-complex protein 1 subunit zeta